MEVIVSQEVSAMKWNQHMPKKRNFLAPKRNSASEAFTTSAETDTFFSLLQLENASAYWVLNLAGHCLLLTEAFAEANHWNRHTWQTLKLEICQEWFCDILQAPCLGEHDYFFWFKKTFTTEWLLIPKIKVEFKGILAFSFCA